MKSMGSIYPKLKFRADERRVYVRQMGEEFFIDKKENSIGRSTRIRDRAKGCMGFVE